VDLWRCVLIHEKKETDLVWGWAGGVGLNCISPFLNYSPQADGQQQVLHIWDLQGTPHGTRRCGQLLTREQKVSLWDVVRRPQASTSGVWEAALCPTSPTWAPRLCRSCWVRAGHPWPLGRVAFPCTAGMAVHQFSPKTDDHTTPPLLSCTLLSPHPCPGVTALVYTA
jgi:hypothetical protein